MNLKKEPEGRMAKVDLCKRIQTHSVYISSTELYKVENKDQY